MKKRSRTEYSLINMTTGFLGYGVNTLTGFICRVVFVRTLSADYLGVGGLFTNILSMLSLAELGISSAIGYSLYKPIVEEDQDKITSLMHFYGKAYRIIGFVIAAAGIAMMPFLRIIIRNPPDIRENLYLIYFLYLAATVFSYFFSYKETLLSAMQRSYIVSGYNYAVTIIQSILQVIFLVLTHSFIGYLLIRMVTMMVYNVCISRKADHDYPYIKRKDAPPLSGEEKKSLFVNVKALTINKISGVLVNSTDNIAITFFDGIRIVGYASNYTLLSGILNKITVMIFNALTGSVGNLNASVDDEGRYSFFKVLNLANFWMFGWAALGMIFVSGDLVTFVFGKEYSLPFYIPLILGINFYTINMLHASYTYKNTLGLFRYGQYLLFFTGIINLVMDVLLGRRLGMFGIYLATLIARACTNLWYEPYAVFRYGLHKSPLIYLKRYFHYAFVLIMTGGICAFFCGLCRFTLPVNVALKILVCITVPNLMFYLCYGKTEEFLYLKNAAERTVSRLRKKKKNNG